VVGIQKREYLPTLKQTGLFIGFPRNALKNGRRLFLTNILPN
jgi:hypothetical protein